MIKLSDLAVYDENITIKELKNFIKKKYPYICPKCNGKGRMYKQDDNYTLGGYHYGGYIDCDICGGYGRTEKEMKPKYQVIGYEQVGE